MNSTEMNPTETHGNDDVWPSAGPAKGLRVRVPIAIASLAVMALVGAATGAALKKAPASTAVQAGAVGGDRAFGAGPNGAAPNGAAGANGAAGRLGGPGGAVVGTISKVEGNTITVTQRDGTTAIVVMPSGATVNKTVSGSVSDLTAGTSIAVRGTTADGRTAAESVTINPPNIMGGPGAGTP